MFRWLPTTIPQIPDRGLSFWLNALLKELQKMQEEIEQLKKEMESVK